MLGQSGINAGELNACKDATLFFTPDEGPTAQAVGVLEKMHCDAASSASLCRTERWQGNR